MDRWAKARSFVSGSKRKLRRMKNSDSRRKTQSDTTSVRLVSKKLDVLRIGTRTLSLIRG
tara:strand:+ start:4259 stop:4438 length:180 start_codon:yes stop_codon:yes gene_type:complete